MTDPPVAPAQSEAGTPSLRMAAALVWTLAIGALVAESQAHVLPFRQACASVNVEEPGCVMVQAAVTDRWLIAAGVWVAGLALVFTLPMRAALATACVLSGVVLLVAAGGFMSVEASKAKLRRMVEDRR